jgi:hypothetical protein
MDWEMLSVWIENTICYSGSSQGIWTCIPCEAGITIIFYWNVPIKLALETKSEIKKKNILILSLNIIIINR